MAKMKFTDYGCINGAYHTDECCNACWNTHPESKSGEMFTSSARFRELSGGDWTDEAMSVDFTYEQAEFLYRKIVGR